MENLIYHTSDSNIFFNLLSPAYKCVFCLSKMSNKIIYELRFNVKFVFLWSCISRKCNLCRGNLYNFKMIKIDFYMWHRVRIHVLPMLGEYLLKAGSVGDGLKRKTAHNMFFFYFSSMPARTLGQKSEFLKLYNQKLTLLLKLQSKNKAECIWTSLLKTNFLILYFFQSTDNKHFIR